MIEKEQFEDIKDKLRVWGEERGLNKEDQKRNFRVDYTKELAKFFEAERDNNQYEMIKALCNMVIVAINAGRHRGHSSSDCEIDNLINPLYNEGEIKGIIRTIESKGYDPYKCLLETIKELNTRTGSWNEEGKWVEDLGAYTLEEAREKAGFNYINKLSKGAKHWYVLGGNSVDDDLAQKSFVRWHKADYASCKLESVE